MISFTKGNLLEADVEAVVNTVNEVGVMGKGIALMFKEAYPENFKTYAQACKSGEVRVGEVFVTRRDQLLGPKWIINFPTKKHWRQKTKMDWIVAGLEDLREFVVREKVQSIAIPPLGSGNGGLEWSDVRPIIVEAMGDLSGVDVIVYEPTREYQNVSKRAGVKKLTPARALIAELIRRYSVLGFECTFLEVQKLAWFLERSIQQLGLNNPLDLRFEAGIYGPYANRLSHLLNALDGSYLRCEKRIPDAGPMDLVRFEDKHKDHIGAYLRSGDAKLYTEALELASNLIDGFESPLGLELLATVSWLLSEEDRKPTIDDIKKGITGWPGGESAGARKQKIFDDRQIGLALQRIGRTAVA